MNESQVEKYFINLLQNQGYTYFYSPDRVSGSDFLQRENFSSVLLENELKQSLLRLNPRVDTSLINQAYQKIKNLGTNDIMANNEKFHSFLTDGITLEYYKNGETRGITLKLIDTTNIHNNTFFVVNQFVVKERNNEKRLDVVIFINGMPLVIVELKNPINEKATLEKAYTQIQNYKKAIPSIFSYNALCIISDGIHARVSSLSAPFSRYLAWRSPQKEENETKTELEIMTERMLQKEVLLNLIKYFTVFEQEEKKDEATGLFSIQKVKKIAAYHQYYAVQKAVEETVRATHETRGNRKIGVIWHTQGSGKSLSMVFYVGNIVTHPAMKNPTVVVVTDRNDLDDQLFATFSKCESLLRQTPVQAESREHLKELLKVQGGGIVFTTIQKFMPEEGNVYETLSTRSNIVVIADEAHRSHYGLKAREVETETGIETKYGIAKYLRDALPNASFIGFTGTPIEKEDRSTRQIFGDEIDIYDIKQAIDDGATVPIRYESRLVKIRCNEKVSTIDYAVDEIEGATKEQKERAKKKNAQIDAILGHPERLKDLAKDIVEHFEARQKVFEGKAMIVCMTRNIAVQLYNEIIKLRPHWHDADLMKGTIKVIMTTGSDDPESFQPHHTTKEERKKLAIRFKDPHDPLQIVIVRDMWLTGFDVPCLHTMYIDKKMQGAALMQAIARVNRVYKDKPGGLIVDYIGIMQDLKNAMRVYIASGGQGQAVVDIAEVTKEMREKYEEVSNMFDGFDYTRYFQAENEEKLKILLEATNCILQHEELKNRFLKEVTALSKLFALVVTSFEAQQIRDNVAFFQAVKSRINKFIPSGYTSDKQVETAIKHIVEEAVSSDGVIDILEIAGIKSDTIDILSEEFLRKVKDMEQKHVAYELLYKLLCDEIHVRKRKNIAQFNQLSKMLESVIKKYHNNHIHTIEVIEELCKIAREMREHDKKALELGLTQEKYAFYCILTEESKKFLGDEEMKECINEIFDTIYKNATVDWEKREDVTAKLRVEIKKILRKYGYSPDVVGEKVDKVIEQSKYVASSFVMDRSF